MRDYVAFPRSIMAQAAIEIAAPPADVAAVYRDAERWGETFAATIDRARIVRAGDNWVEVEVEHRKKGRVPSTLILLSDATIALSEGKKRFDAGFLNRFEPRADGGTHYVVEAYVRLKGFHRLLVPLLRRHARGRALEQIRTCVLEPLKAATERTDRRQAAVSSAAHAEGRAGAA
jgi:hypothetical protein